MEGKIRFEKEISQYLDIPCPPKKEWDKESSFDNGVAVIRLITGGQDYAVCRYDADKDKEVRIVKVFGGEPFNAIVSVYPVPSYMEADMEAMDLTDEASKEAMEELLAERHDIINEGIEANIKTYEWGYDFIHNRKEAEGFLRSRNVKGRIPINDDVLKCKLQNMAREDNIKNNK